MPINAKHKEFISRNISDAVIHTLQGVLNNDEEFIPAEAIRRRIVAIKAVLATNKHEQLPEGEECIGFANIRTPLKIQF